jgi:hypothetical protein
MTKPRSKARGAKPEAVVHLGDRLLALGRVNAGACTLAEAARSLGVDVAQLRKWQQIHAGDRIVSVSELRSRNGTALRRLRARALRLAHLVARSERVLRTLHQRLLRTSQSEHGAAGLRRHSKHSG